MFQTRTFSRLGLFLWLIAVMAMGPMAHRHATTTSQDTAVAHDGAHSHDYNGGTIDLDLPDSGHADTQDPNHSHLAFSLDHLHDSWIYLAATVAPVADLFALPPRVDPRFPLQNMVAQIKKPPRTILIS